MSSKKKLGEALRSRDGSGKPKNDLRFELNDLRVKLNLMETKLSFRILDLEKQTEAFEKKMEERFDKVMEHLVDIAGKFQKFDDERVVMGEHLRCHEDRIEKLEEIFKTS